jgi:DNA-binding PadR family transcriptional regulator
MPLPEITHLQFLVLAILTDGELAGREVRDRLAEAGERKSGPAFYQFMARLEAAGFVEGWYDQKVVDGQIIKERRYRVTGAGSKAFEDTRDFYLARRGLGLQGT